MAKVCYPLSTAGPGHQQISLSSKRVIYIICYIPCFHCRPRASANFTLTLSSVLTFWVISKMMCYIPYTLFPLQAQGISKFEPPGTLLDRFRLAYEVCTNDCPDRTVHIRPRVRGICNWFAPGRIVHIKPCVQGIYAIDLLSIVHVKLKVKDNSSGFMSVAIDGFTCFWATCVSFRSQTMRDGNAAQVSSAHASRLSRT